MKFRQSKILLAGSLALGLSVSAVASNFGTSKTYSQMYSPTAFHPQSDNNNYYKDEDELYCVAGSENRFYSAVHLPTGARPTSLVAIMRDNYAPSSISAQLVRTCNGFTGFINPNTILTNTTIASVSSVGNSAVRSYYTGNASENHNVNNLRCAYTMRVTFNGQCNGSNHELNRVALRYKRDVTPAPTGAPYADVPAAHPFAQHINALKSSGITGGCGGNNFCPDDPLTRGQMAVFLAKALGLSWSDSNGISIIVPPILP